MTQGAANFSRGRLVAASVVAIAVIGLGVCEVMGWPFLAAPMQRWLGDALERRVSLSADPAARPEAVIRLLGRVEIRAAHLEIGAPRWSSAPHMLLARDARITFGYADLWRARQGAPLRIRELRAVQLDGLLERLADGHASWQFGKNTDTPDTARLPARVPMFGRLQVDSGGLVYRDALMALDLDARFSLVEGADIAAASGAASGPAAGLQFKATGAFQGRPLSIDAHAAGVLPAVTDEAAALPVTINARVGRASLVFEGTATDALHLKALTGRFTLQGPSLAAVGDPLGVTLPTTGPFRAEGRLAKQGVVWNTVLDRVSIGSSRLAGAFVFDRRPPTPTLAGRLTGTQLALADLGPAFGAPVYLTAAQATADPAPRPAGVAPGRVLPSRDFDLPALRAMDANVLIDIDSLDLGTRLLEPLKPLRTHLVLADGVLTLRDLDARTAQGRLSGTVQLDGRAAQALWTADLRWDGVRLEHWIRQTRANEAPPYVTGSLGGQARVAGQGKSTAAVLGSLRGEVRMQLKNGTISHFAVEAAGLDIAEGLGMLIKGDDTLPIQCAMVDLVADQGVLRPRVLVLDTRDSTLWMDGSVSLATEALDLRVVVAPKDFSPLALRTPLRVRGSFANPSISLEKGTLGARLGASALLALVTPLAALIPLIDIGSSDDAKRGADACRALADRARARPLLSPAVLAR